MTSVYVVMDHGEQCPWILTGGTQIYVLQISIKKLYMAVNTQLVIGIMSLQMILRGQFRCYFSFCQMKDVFITWVNSGRIQICCKWVFKLTLDTPVQRRASTWNSVQSSQVSTLFEVSWTLYRKFNIHLSLFIWLYLKYLEWTTAQQIPSTFQWRIWQV